MIVKIVPSCGCELSSQNLLNLGKVHQLDEKIDTIVQQLGVLSKKISRYTEYRRRQNQRTTKKRFMRSSATKGLTIVKV